MSEAAQQLDQIVVAEDSPPNRKILTHLLEKLGYEVISCEDGHKAWEEMKSGKHNNIKAVLSDVMMPNMDGISFLRAIRESDKFKTLPVILVTAVSEKEYIIQAKSLNVNGYVLKPLTFQRVQNKLRELFPDKVFPKLAG